MTSYRWVMARGGIAPATAAIAARTLCAPAQNM
jgi:hypothetical protein